MGNVFENGKYYSLIGYEKKKSKLVEKVEVKKEEPKIKK